MQHIIEELQAYTDAVCADINTIDQSQLSQHDHMVVEQEWMGLATIMQDGVKFLEGLDTWSARDDHGLDVHAVEILRDVMNSLDEMLQLSLRTIRQANDICASFRSQCNPKDTI